MRASLDFRVPILTIVLISTGGAAFGCISAVAMAREALLLAGISLQKNQGAETYLSNELGCSFRSRSRTWSNDSGTLDGLEWWRGLRLPMKYQGLGAKFVRRKIKYDSTYSAAFTVK